MLKTTRSSDSTQRNNDDEVVGDSGKNNLSKSKKSKNAKSGIQMHIGATEEPTFLPPNAREAFNQLKQAFTKAPIFQHFDPKCHIQIKPNTSGYIIGRILSQLTFDHLTFNQGQWHLVVYFLRKMISAETNYQTHDSEFLAIIKAFKTWYHYLENYKHKVMMLTDYNNYCWFMDTKSLSSK